MTDYKSIYESVVADPAYQANLDWGKPRGGHPEATARAHIEELERNLEKIKDRVSESDFWKLKILIHTHDSFKADAVKGVPITDPNSHASLACKFLHKHTDDATLLNIVQYHDEPYALWKQQRDKGRYNHDRLANLYKISDWDLFIAFNIIDNCTDGKDRAPLRWFIEENTGKKLCNWTIEDIL
jgi:hypothetical protein